MDRRIDLVEGLAQLLQLETEMEAGWTDCTVNGECSNCGNCCGNFLPLSAKEIKTIKRYLQKHPIKEQIHRYPTAQPMTDVTCPFRSEKEKKCLIYEIRPMICRDYRCDKPRKKIKADRDLYQGKYSICDMRYEFFGRKTL